MFSKMYSTRWFYRLYRKDFIRKFNNVRAADRAESTNDKNTPKKNFEASYEKYKDKIKFNSHLESEKLELGYYRYYLKTMKRAKRDDEKELERKCLQPLPLALKYLVDKDKLLKSDTDDTQQPEKIFQLPFGNSTKVVRDNHVSSEQFNIESGSETKHTDIDKWMTAYEHFDDSCLETDCDEVGIDNGWSKQYGTPDVSARVSPVPCGGCGALLHCNDPSIPGYLPSEIFKGQSVKQLRATECQRCHFLKEYNIALDVCVEPEEYETLLKSIRHVKSLVVMMVDLLDFPCSVWPGIVDIIGTDRPLFIVGNKLDLLPGDSIGYIKRIKQSLVSEINKTNLREANIKYVSLISAKTGFGVEDLISAMFKLWLYKGDVFLIGCTNVGKSSLFNALLLSDYCKVHAVDIVKRATVSQWPGTTLNLLKFPINRPSGWKIYERGARLTSERQLLKYEEKIRNSQIEGTPAAVPLPSLISHIGRTFSDPRGNKDYFTQSDVKGYSLGLDKNDKMFAKSKWFYDTPGVIQPDQVLNLLTTEELLITIPKDLIRPQTYYMYKGSSIFIGGLARIDFLDCAEPCRFTVFCSDGLPITITETEHADEVYNEFLGTELFGAPIGGSERLSNWPGLQKHSSTFEFTGDGPKLCCGDIVLSSVGWVAITTKKDSVCTVNAWTPGARGIHVRKPSMLQYAVNLKGKKIRDSPAYMVGKVFVEE